MPARPCACSKPARATGIPTSISRPASSSCSTSPGLNWLYTQEPSEWTGGRPHPRAARQDARRIELDQRPHLQSRPAARLRQLGAARQPRLGLCRRAALFQAARAPHRRGRRHLSRPRRRAHRHRHRLASSAVRGLHRGRDEPRHSAQPRLQRRKPGRRRLRAARDPQGPPRQRGARVPAAGDAAAEPRRAHRARTRRRSMLRRQARGRRALSQGRTRTARRSRCARAAR